MRKWIVALLFLGLAHPPAMAQKHVGPRPRLVRQLNLTPRQQQRIHNIMRENREHPDRPRMYRRIRRVLTPEQMDHLRDIRRQQRQERQ